MTTPGFEGFGDAQEVAFAKRPPEEILHIAACRNVLLIVRPTKYQANGFKTSFKDDTDAIFADIAVLDDVPPWVDNDGNPVIPHPAGRQFRNQLLLQGYLKGTFKGWVGKTLIGTIYTEPSGKGKPSIKWRSLAQDPQCVARGQQFLAANPQFLIPVEAQISDTSSQPDRYPAPSGTPGTAAATGNGNYQGASGWNQNAPMQAGAQVIASAAAGDPRTGMSTLDQMRAAVNQGATSDAPPF